MIQAKYIPFFVHCYVASDTALQIWDEVTITYKGEMFEYNWEKYGFEIHFNPNSLPAGVEKCKIHISIALNGDFHFPENMEPASLVYRIHSSCKLQKSITITMKHFAAEECRDDLRIAISSDVTLPYKFYIQESGYFESDYGQVQVKSFSLFTILFNRIRSHFIKSYIVSLIKDDYSKIAPAQFCCKLFFIVVKRHPFFKSQIDNYFKGKTEAGQTTIRFSRDAQEWKLATNDFGHELDIGWSIHPVAPPVLYKADIDSYFIGKPPLCELNLIQKCAGNPFNYQFFFEGVEGVVYIQPMIPCLFCKLF